MKYPEAMQVIDTEKALTFLGFTVKKDGSYFKFPCIECGNESAIRYHGEKKNVAYCPTCKAGSNIISMAVKVKGIEFQEAKNLLIEKTAGTSKPIEEELNLNYTLEWCKEMETLGLNQIICQGYGVGRPKGKTMLSGHIVFTVLNQQGIKVAYWGIKDGKPKFHSSFNPELYLYNLPLIETAEGDFITEEVWLTNDMFNCLRLIAEKKKVCCNFNLPYLSVKQYELLSNFNRVVFNWKGDKRDIAYSNIANLKTFYRFV